MVSLKYNLSVRHPDIHGSIICDSQDVEAT